MAKKSSFFLAILLIVNPFMLLFFQNCSALPQASKESPDSLKSKPQAENTTKEVVLYNFKKPF
ncbi:MAG: hypothetical protein H7256_06340 [Bdellovibrio sp.]|nr:hypothetical protein [Bdellovibrio sp.]